MWSSCLRREGELRDKNGGTSSGRQPLRCGKISRPPFWFEGSCPGRSRSTFACRRPSCTRRNSTRSTFKRSDFAPFSYFRPLHKLQSILCNIPWKRENHDGAARPRRRARGPRSVPCALGAAAQLRQHAPPPRSPRGVSPLPKAKPLNPRNRKSGKFWGKLWGSVARKKFSERLARLNLRDLLRQCRKRMEGRGP